MNVVSHEDAAFEQYARDLGLSSDDPRRDMARGAWESERAAAASYPAIIPPCPSWCALPAGHPYDSWGGPLDAIEHVRVHSTETRVVVSSVENNTNGAVTLTDPVIEVFDDLKDGLTGEQARSLAADLLAAADRFDAVTAAS